MAKNTQTFKVDQPRMRGTAIKNLQRTIKREFRHLGIDCPIKLDGIYGVATRSYVAALLRARGISRKLMEDGVTYELRQKIFNRQMTGAERKRFHAKTTKEYRQKLKKQWTPKKVHAPVATILADSWGYHPGVHDGIDVITKPAASLFAMVKAKVIDVRTGGWWGKAPSGDVSKGDGIVQLRVLEDVGPFKKGQHIGYGHCENPRVKVGDIVEAGDHIANAGLAVAWHIHLMVNNGTTTKGIGNIDPRKHLDYAVKHG